MEIINFFIKIMKLEFGITVNHQQVSYESNQLYHDEIDEALIPATDLAKLPDPILFETILYTDNKDNEWIAGIVVNQETSKRIYLVCIKDGQRVLNRFLDEEK